MNVLLCYIVVDDMNSEWMKKAVEHLLNTTKG